MLTRKTLLILLCSWSIVAYAQWVPNSYTKNHVVTTDYNTCLQGVKDSTGKWVIAAVYERLYRTGYYEYIAMAGGHCGIIDTAGQIIIPFIYDNIAPYSAWHYGVWNGCYDVSLNGKHGIVNRSNKVIVPIEYLSVSVNQDSTALARDNRVNWWVYRLDGSSFRLPWKSKDMPQHCMPHTYIFKRKQIGKKYRYGVVKDNGKVILERKYSRITAFTATNTLEVVRNGKRGYYSPDGTMLWPLIFDEERFRFFYSRRNDHLGAQEIASARVNGRSGLVSVYGDTLLPFEYSEIEAFKSTKDNTLWNVKSGIYSGVYDQNKGWIIPMDTSRIASVTSWLNPFDSTSTGLIIAGKPGRIGAMLTNGQVIIPFNCSTYYSDSNTEYVFMQGDSLLFLSIVYPSDRERAIAQLNLTARNVDVSRQAADSVHFMSRSNVFHSFYGQENMVAYYNPDRTHDTLSTKTSKFPMTGRYGAMNLPDSIALSAQIIVRPLHRTLVEGDNFRIYGLPWFYDKDTAQVYPDFALVQHGEKPSMNYIRFTFYDERYEYYITEMNDVLRKDGRMLLNGDSIGYVDVFNRGCDGRMYLRASVKGGYAYYDTAGIRTAPVSPYPLLDFSDHYGWARHPKTLKYQLIDRRNNAILTSPGQMYEMYHPIWDSLTILESANEGRCLYNIPQKRLLITHVDAIRSLDVPGSCFAVRTCNGKFGVVDSEGRMLVDTLYSSMVPLRYHTSFLYGEYEEFDMEKYASYYEYWLFTGGDSVFAFDVKRKTKLSASGTRELILEEAVIFGCGHDRIKFLKDSAQNYMNYVQAATIFLMHEDTIDMLPWHLNTIFDTVFAPLAFDNSHGYYYLRYMCKYCRNNGSAWTGYQWFPFEEDRPAYMIVYRTDSVLTFAEFNTYNVQASRHIGYYSMFNVMMFPDGPHQMTLDSLFVPTSDWRNFIINTVLNHVNTHEQVKGDCHNPAGIPDLLRNAFLISDEGLVLMPAGFTEKGAQLQLTIPWSTADPYLRADLKSRLPMNKNQ